MPETPINTHHNHPPDYWLSGKAETDKKDKIRLKILLTAIGIALLLLIICVLLAIGRANVKGYIPTLILELDLTPIGKPPLVLGTIKLPQVSGKFPEKLKFPEQTLQKDLEFNQAFTPVISRRVEYVPVYDK